MQLLKKIRDLEEEIKDNPSSKAFIALSESYIQIDEIEKAKRICKEGLKKYPKCQGAKVVMAEILYYENKIDQAILLLSEVIKENPLNLKAYKILGSIYEDLGDLKKAKEFFEKAWISDPEDKEVRLKLKNLEKRLLLKDKIKLILYKEKLEKYLEIFINKMEGG